MSRPAVVVENLTKVYRIGRAERRADTLVGAVGAALAAPVRNFRSLYRLGSAGRDGDADDTIRAVDDVSFEVAQGETFGIIGRNGAGKSTLLKILSRVTKPTSGRVRMRGRVSSLLEVGTGFHPELTGRENVYLNGTILGMTKREIDRKFDEIVDFSGVAQFLDTPVKRYSSGMKVRLAFAVAAHLEPEILIVDEVLAVGDAAFQKKCLGKMQDISRGGGRTILFVSHNMTAVSSFCSRSVFLIRGALGFDGDTESCIEHYMREEKVIHSEIVPGAYAFADRVNPYGRGERLIRGARLLDGAGRPTSSLRMGKPFALQVEIEEPGLPPNAQVGFILRSSTEQRLSMHNSGMTPVDTEQAHTRRLFTFLCARTPLMPGSYWLDLSVATKAAGRIDFVERAVSFEVFEADVYGSGYQLKHSDGIFYIEGSWAAGGE
jgi:lipopolysaccharide transport system ATP-binding protein